MCTLFCFYNASGIPRFTSPADALNRKYIKQRLLISTTHKFHPVIDMHAASWNYTSPKFNRAWLCLWPNLTGPKWSRFFAKPKWWTTPPYPPTAPTPPPPSIQHTHLPQNVLGPFSPFVAFPYFRPPFFPPMHKRQNVEETFYGCIVYDDPKMS